MNYISLGYFCGIANELGRLGLRTASSPFDWILSDFEGVITNIENHFTNYLNYNFMSQNMQNHAVYKDTNSNIIFCHDFNKYKSLKKQLPKVAKKYNKRIERFYKLITSPTLFIRYISDEETINGISKELLYIEDNYDKILKLLKSFNSSNDILFIANNGVLSSNLTIYNVPKDDNDVVARKPIFANPDLEKKLNDVEIPNKQKNINRYLKKEKRKKSIYCLRKRKLVSMLKKIFLKEYIHEKQYGLST